VIDTLVSSSQRCVCMAPGPPRTSQRSQFPPLLPLSQLRSRHICILMVLVFFSSRCLQFHNPLLVFIWLRVPGTVGSTRARRGGSSFFYREKLEASYVQSVRRTASLSFRISTSALNAARVRHRHPQCNLTQSPLKRHAAFRRYKEKWT
jgi:hypothetical protein